MCVHAPSLSFPSLDFSQYSLLPAALPLRWFCVFAFSIHSATPGQADIVFLRAGELSVQGCRAAVFDRTRVTPNALAVQGTEEM